MGTWILGRLIVFPSCCVYASLIGPEIVKQRITNFDDHVLLLPSRWMSFMLVILLFLQVFWTYYIGKAFVEVNVSAKIATNSYEAV